MSTISVEFSSPVFHICSPAHFSSEDLDMACGFLCEKVRKQEENLVEKLHNFHGILQLVKFNGASISGKAMTMSDELMKSQGSILRKIIQMHFNDEQFSASNLCTALNSPLLPVCQQITSQEAEQIKYDVYLLLINSDPSVQFTGRAIARIFYRLGSPLFPAKRWGKCWLWGKYIELNFDQLCQIATKKLEEIYQSVGIAMP